MTIRVKVSAALFVAVLSLAVAESIVRVVLPAQIYTDERNLTYRHDAQLGWFPQENSRKQFQGSRSIGVKHNALGFRDKEYQENDVPNIVVLGDSFVWGTAVLNRLFVDLSTAI